MGIVSLPDEEVPLPSVSGVEGTYTPTASETFDAFMSRENVVGALANKVSTVFSQTDEYDPLYDPMDDIEGYEAYADDFKQINNKMDGYYLKKQIDESRQARDTIASSGGVPLVAAMIGSQVLDPINYLPAFGAGKAASALTAIQKVGLGVAAGASSAAMQEGALYALDPTRTGEEVAFGIGGASIVGGAIGGAYHLFDPEMLATAGTKIEKSFSALQADDAFDQVLKSGGAAASNVFTKEGQQVSSALGAEKLFDFNDPVIRTLTSPSVKTQELSERLSRTALLKEKYKSGVASHIPVEEKIAAHDSIRVKYRLGIDDIYSKYKKESKARGEKPMSYGEFGVEVTKANRRNDTSDIPEVSEAAKFVRNTIYNPYLNEADKLGMIKAESIKLSDESYAPRVWNRDKIESENASWTEKNLAYFTRRRNEQASELESLDLDLEIRKINEDFSVKAKELKAAESKFEEPMAEVKINKLRADADKAIDELKTKYETLKKRVVEDEYLISEVDTLTNRILGTPYGRLKYDLSADHDMPAFVKKKESVRGPMKARVYDIPTSEVEDFVVNDLDHIVESHIRTMSRDTEVFREFGTLEPEDIMKDIEADYKSLMTGKSDKEVSKLRKQMKADMRDIGYMFERLRGIDSSVSADYYGSKLGQAERLAMKWNFVRLLGGMTISAMSDIARPIMAKGLMPFLKDGVAAFATDMKTFRKAAEELRDEAAIGLDMVLNSRIRSIMGVDDYLPATGKVEQKLDQASQIFSKATLMSPWNASMKQFSGVIVQSQMIKAIKAIEDGTVTPKQVRDLASSYIDKDMAKRIGQQLSKYGDNEGSVFLANMRQWDDALAKDTFASAIRKEVDNIIITPSMDRPIWMTKPGWRLVGQFRSFAFSSMQKALISGLQRRDMEMLNGLMVAVSLGTLSRMIKADLAGYELSDDPAKLILEGIDASGVTGYLMDANNIMEKVTAGRVGLNPMIGQAPMSRYASRSALASVMGPTYGLVGDSLDLSTSAFSGSWKASDSHTLRQLIPFNNIFWLRQPLDKAEENINKFFGVPENRQGKKR